MGLSPDNGRWSTLSESRRMTLELILAVIFGSIIALAIAMMVFPRWVERTWLRHMLPWAAGGVCLIIVIFIVTVMGSRGR